MVCKNFNSAHSNIIDMCLGAPETYRSKNTESTPLPVTQEVDMWSIGCVFSEVAVWAHHGWKKVKEYRRQRNSEIEIKGGGPDEHFFHWDGRLLDAVNNIHQDMTGGPFFKDFLTRSVLERLVVNMLQHKSRPYAKLVFEMSERLVQEFETRLGVSVDKLERIANGELVRSDEARAKTGNSLQVANEHYRSHAEENLSLKKPVPPDDNSTPPPPPSSPSSSSRSSTPRHHQSSASQNDKRFSNPAKEIPQPGGLISTVVPDPPPPSTTAKTHEDSSQQHVQQRPEEPERPTLSIDEGHAWKEKKKNGGVAVLPGYENLTSLDRRDHVSLILS